MRRCRAFALASIAFAGSITLPAQDADQQPSPEVMKAVEATFPNGGGLVELMLAYTDGCGQNCSYRPPRALWAGRRGRVRRSNMRNVRRLRGYRSRRRDADRGEQWRLRKFPGR